MVSNSAVACPPREQLNEFFRGTLTGGDSETIGEHLGCCPECLAALDDLKVEDPFLNAVEQAGQQSVKLTPEWETLIDGLGELSHRASVMSNPWRSTMSDQPMKPVDLSKLLSPPEAPNELGRIHQFCVLNKLAQGGMGVVLEAYDSKLDRRVALKVMLPQDPPRPELVQRFEREAKALATLRSDHVVEVLSVGEVQTVGGRVPYLSMPLLQGETLADRLLTGALPLPQFLDLADQLALGLSEIHSNQLVHRDIKPGNLWLESPGPEFTPPAAGATGERVKFLDFGLARLEQDVANLTRTGEALGTPGYMAPEQFFGHDVDQRSDLFGLGAVLYEMVTGSRAFDGPHNAAILIAVINGDPIDPTGMNPAIPKRLSSLILRLLSKQPEGRPESALKVVDELQHIRRETSLGSPARSKTSWLRRWFI